MMKKLNTAAICLFTLILLSGCKKVKQEKTSDEISISPVPTNTITEAITPAQAETVSEETKDTASEVTLKISDYYPFLENVKYIYDGEGNEYASYTVFTDYIAGNRAQFRINNGGSETIKVLENTNGTLIIHLSRGETYFRENYVDKTDGNDEILLKEPLVKGTEWTLSDNRRRYISNTGVDITTPYGTFKTIEVTTEENSTTDKSINYYAKDIGLVKSIYSTKAYDITSELSKIEKNTPFTQSVIFYYPNTDGTGIVAVEKSISFQTNDISRIKIQEAYVGSSNNKLLPAFSTNTKINSLFLNNDDIVSVDLSNEFITEMNLGAGFEGLILQCITNTLGNYYGVNQVHITIEGKPYESGHIAMNKNETFKVNYDNVIQ